MTRQSTAAAFRRLAVPQETHPARRVRRRPRARTAGRSKAARFVVTLGVVVGMLFLLGVRQATITALGYEIDAKKRELQALRAERDALEATLAGLAAPQRVEKGALALGMTAPSDFRLARVVPLEPVAQPEVETASAVVKLQPRPAPEEGMAVASEPRAWVEQVGQWLYAWLTGGQVQAETLH